METPVLRVWGDNRYMAPAEGLYKNEILGRKGELCWDGLQSLTETLWETLFLALKGLQWLVRPQNLKPVFQQWLLYCKLSQIGIFPSSIYLLFNIYLFGCVES